MLWSSRTETVPRKQQLPIPASSGRRNPSSGLWEVACSRHLISRLASFPEHHVFRVHPRCSTCHNFLPCWGWGISHCVCKPHLFTRHLVVHTWVVSTFWLTRRTYSRICVPALIFAALYPEVRWPGHRVILCLTFWGTTTLFGTVAAWLYTSVTSAQGSSLFRLHRLTLSCHPVGVRWYLIVALIYISLMISNWAFLRVLIGHLYIFFGECLFKSFALFKSGCFCCWIVGVLSIFWALIPDQRNTLQIYSSILGVTFPLCSWCPLVHKSFKFCWSPF